MTLLAAGPWTVVDDDGTGLTGTPINAAFIAAIKDSIEDVTHSPTNPTVDPFETTDEVVTARGGFASLDARLDDIEADIVAVPTEVQAQNTLGRTNIASNEIFLLWHLGDTSEPSMWDLTGAGGSVLRCGTGLADTNTKIGDFCSRIRRVAADTKLTQIVVSGAAFTRAASALQGKVVNFGAWVRSTAIAGARIFIDDGVGTTYSTANAAAGTWEWLKVARTLDVAATTLNVGIIDDVNGADAYLSGVTVFLSDSGSVPLEWVPAPVVYHSYNFMFSGAAAITTPKFVWPCHRPGIVKDVQLVAGVVPTGAALIIDVNTWDGAAFTSMFTTRPQIAAGARGSAAAQPDTTYARRCLYPDFSAPSVTGSMLSIDIDQVGSGVAGSDVTISVRVLHPLRFLESILTYNDI